MCWLWTVLVKFIGTIASVASGLVVGPEGPLVRHRLSPRVFPPPFVAKTPPFASCSRRRSRRRHRLSPRPLRCIAARSSAPASPEGTRPSVAAPAAGWAARSAPAGPRRQIRTATQGRCPESPRVAGVKSPRVAGVKIRSAPAGPSCSRCSTTTPTAGTSSRSAPPQALRAPRRPPLHALWTATQHDGPNHLGLRLNRHYQQPIALITSGAGRRSARRSAACCSLWRKPRPSGTTS